MANPDLDHRHPFDAATALAQAGPGRWQGHTSAAYANMIGLFGGITAASLLAAVLADPAREGDPLALTVNFAGPLADGAFEIHTEAARTNRSTQHWLVRMQQGAQTVATATAVLATRRKTWSSLEAGRPTAPPPEGLHPAQAMERVRWTSAYDMRFVHGGLSPHHAAAPGATTSDSTSLLWVRDTPPRPLDFCSLAALCDVFFPRLYVRRPGQWVPIGTVSFSVYFHADTATLAQVGELPVLGHARAHQFRDGFFDQSAEMWGPGDELLAVTHQMVYFKE